VSLVLSAEFQIVVGGHDQNMSETPGFSDKVHIGSARVSDKSTGPVRVVEFDTDEEAEHRLICHAEFRPQERDFNAQFTNETNYIELSRARAV